MQREEERGFSSFQLFKHSFFFLHIKLQLTMTCNDRYQPQQSIIYSGNANGLLRTAPLMAPLFTTIEMNSKELGFCSQIMHYVITFLFSHHLFKSNCFLDSQLSTHMWYETLRAIFYLSLGISLQCVDVDVRWGCSALQQNQALSKRRM